MYRNILDYFEETVANSPQKTALLHHDEQMTFAELHQESKRLAALLYSHFGGQKNRPVAVFLPKSFEVYVCDIGITYSANFFSNLDIKTPAERIGNILQLMQPLAVITKGKYKTILEQIEGSTIPILDLDAVDWNTVPDHGAELAQRLKAQIDTDPFCIINTSGSTGTPKGVVLNHRSFFDFMQWSFDTFHLNGDEIVGALSPVVFDIYDFELCLMMWKGSTIALLDAELAAFPARLLQEVQAKKVSFLFWVPTIMVNIANMGLLDRIPLPDLRTVWFAGEVFPTKQFNVWKQHFPQVVFANLYGPIEITLDCVYYIADHDLDESEPLPIGIPCHNTDILILNEENKLCKTNEIGELCVRGTSLAMGYYNDPEKTAAAFVQNPLNHAYPELIYRTGDLAYTDDRGLIIFKGRKDSLIKHMGYRIELGEIEHIAVNTLHLVHNCCVVYNYARKSITLIYEKDQTITDLEIKKALSKQLPRYMVPADFIQMDLLPRNTNGKIDRLKLSSMINRNE